VFEFHIFRRTHNMALTDHLKLRGRTYYVRVQIPPRLWAAVGGKREFVKTLKTGDLHEANRLKHAHVAAFQARIRALGRREPAMAPDLHAITSRALGWRRSMEQDKGQVLFYHGDEPVYKTDEWLSQIGDEADNIELSHDEETALRFFKIAKGEGTPLRDLVDPWLDEQAGDITAQTAAQHRIVLTAFINWVGQEVLVEEVDRRKAGEFATNLLTPASGLKRKTAQRYVSSLSSLWQWLLARGIAKGDNPWRGLAIGKKGKRGETQVPKQWRDAGLKALLTGARTERYTDVFHDLVRLALVTGARLDELCELRTDDVRKRKDGWWASIRQGKTEAAVREVPLHDSAAHVIERRYKSSKDGFLFTGLVPGGPDKKRSWNVSKAFGHYTRKVVPSEERQTFHGLRNTFTEAMEQAAVPESTTQLIIGHKRQSLTYGHYSQGERLRDELRSYINRLRYSAEVMRLIEATTSPRRRKHR
jgi:integrase